MAMVLIIASMGTSSRAQFNFVGSGSTPQGDYLRGVGVAAYGIGMGEYNEARANAINVDTDIKLNEYIYSVLKHENEENAAHRHAKLQMENEAFKTIRQRILENPEARRGQGQRP